MEEGDGLKGKEEIPMDERREAALASAAPLQPTFEPLAHGVSHQQLSKFQELHRRRLLIKSKSKNHDKSQEKKGKRPRKTPDTKSCIAANFSKSSVDEKSAAFGSKNNKWEANTSPQSDDCSSHHVAKKQWKKLHWGLDTKDRWEMKANM